ncbi:MAG TPA: hypothetical protein VHN82_04240, partial [Methanoregula sp.]|nr:hypothetical protein [Methanoregula sp.]
IGDMAKHPVVREPVKIAETEGDQIIEVYQGDFRELPRILAPGSHPLTALDLFEKKDAAATAKIQKEWLARAGGGGLHSVTGDQHLSPVTPASG